VLASRYFRTFWISSLWLRIRLPTPTSLDALIALALPQYAIFFWTSDEPRRRWPCKRYVPNTFSGCLSSNSSEFVASLECNDCQFFLPNSALTRYGRTCGWSRIRRAACRAVAWKFADIQRNKDLATSLVSRAS
jgi:hypothetical protein